MPGEDGTGPNGTGPRTGRQMGNCNGAAPIGRGMRIGFGRGCRRRALTPVTLTSEEEKKILKAELEQIEAEKTEIEKMLKAAKK